MPKTFSYEIEKLKHPPGVKGWKYNLQIFAHQGTSKALVATTPFMTRPKAEADAQLKLARFRKQDQERGANLYSIEAFKPGNPRPIANREAHGYKKMRQTRGDIYREHKHIRYQVYVTNVTRGRRIK